MKKKPHEIKQAPPPKINPPAVAKMAERKNSKGMYGLGSMPKGQQYGEKTVVNMLARTERYQCSKGKKEGGHQLVDQSTDVKHGRCKLRM